MVFNLKVETARESRRQPSTIRARSFYLKTIIVFGCISPAALKVVRHHKQGGEDGARYERNAKGGNYDAGAAKHDGTNDDASKEKESPRNCDGTMGKHPRRRRRFVAMLHGHKLRDIVNDGWTIQRQDDPHVYPLVASKPRPHTIRDKKEKRFCRRRIGILMLQVGMRMMSHDVLLKPKPLRIANPISTPCRHIVDPRAARNGPVRSVVLDA